MDILKILKSSGKDLYPEDLEFFLTELDTGDYPKEYAEECWDKISELRHWLAGDRGDGKETDIAVLQAREVTEASNESGQAPGESSRGVEIKLGDLAPGEALQHFPVLSPAEVIFHDLAAIRSSNTYKAEFKNYVIKHPEINTAFVDAHYSLFRPWEIDTIIAMRQMDEDFLEKYFNTLDHWKIARYQQFSESFFMKHFSQLDATVVLTKGKNSWRQKGHRSKQLDVFLRLKGVKV